MMIVSSRNAYYGFYDFTYNSVSCSSFPRTAVTATIDPAGTWSGATSTDWSVATNWCGNAVPTSSIDALIKQKPNSPVLNTTQSVRKLTIASGVPFTLNATLNVADSLNTNNNTITGSGKNRTERCNCPGYKRRP